METAAAQRAWEALIPNSPIGGIITALVIPALAYILGFRFQFRQDRRAEGESFGTLMAKLTQMQSDELKRLSAEIDLLRRQIETFSTARFRLQATADTMREQIIACRVLVHDYERRLGLPETVFPPIPVPTFSGPV